MNDGDRAIWNEMQRDALPEYTTLRHRTGHSGGRRACTTGKHVIEKGVKFDEVVAVIDGSFIYEVTCWDCMDEWGLLPFTRCFNPGPHGCGSCDACVAWHEDERAVSTLTQES